MIVNKFLIIGNGAREAIFANKLAIDSIVYAIVSHENPTILDAVTKTGGKLRLGDINDGKIIADFAKENSIDYVFVNSDNPLANGVVDELLAQNIKAIGPTKEGARIEWDKIYSIDLLNKILPEFAPRYYIINDESDIDKALDFFSGADLVVKPQGLTGGKGVKVMGEHLKDYKDVESYIIELIEHKNKVLITEKFTGFEFTIMGITDGEDIKFAPATYDYPYRFVADTGPGTGGMGCFTMADFKLPFLSEQDLQNCYKIMREVISYLKENNIHYNGVINGGFFMTSKGIKFMEFNARFGDPEGVNVLSLLKSSFSDLLITIYNKKLAEFNCEFDKKASVVKYLVSNEYPNKGPKITFNFDVKDIEEKGVDVYFSAAKSIEKAVNLYETVSSSRVIALCCKGDDLIKTSQYLNEVINSFIATIGLDYRPDIASQLEIEKLSK